MSSIILPSPWTRQPQYPALINRGGKFSAGLLSAPLMSAQGRDMANLGRSVVLKVGSSFSPTINGVSLLGAGTDPQGLELGGGSFSALFPGSDSARFTVAMGVIPFATGVREMFVSDHNAAGSVLSFGLEQEVANTFKVYIVRSSTQTIAGGTVVAGKMVHLLYTDIKATQIGTLYIDGASVGTLTNGGTALNAGGTLRVGAPGAYTGAVRFRGTVAYFYVWDNWAFSAGEVKEFTRNPWQVFQPIQRRLFFGAAAAGGTTITGALGTAVAIGYTATVNANRTIASALGTATATGYTASLNINRTIAGVLGTATATGFQATVTNDNSTYINGTLGVVTATGFTANLTTNWGITGALGIVVASGFTATVQSGGVVSTSVGGGAHGGGESHSSGVPWDDPFEKALRAPYKASQKASVSALTPSFPFPQKPLDRALAKTIGKTLAASVQAELPPLNLAALTVQREDDDEIPDEVIALALM